LKEATAVTEMKEENDMKIKWKTNDTATKVLPNFNSKTTQQQQQKYCNCPPRQDQSMSKQNKMA
jgi:hypothetical protein